jgi:hypothetical protein
VLPLMLVQDAWRYAFIVDRPAAAVAVDVAWLAGVCAVLPLAPAGVDAQWYVVAWGLASGFGVAVGVVIGRLQTVPPPQLVLPLGGAMVGAGQGYAAGFGLGNVASVAIWWAAFHPALRHGQVTHDDAEPVRAALAAPAA